VFVPVIAFAPRGARAGTGVTDFAFDEAFVGFVELLGENFLASHVITLLRLI
jgi:hypothetical protein